LPAGDRALTARGPTWIDRQRTVSAARPAVRRAKDFHHEKGGGTDDTEKAPTPRTTPKGVKTSAPVATLREEAPPGGFFAQS